MDKTNEKMKWLAVISVLVVCIFSLTEAFGVPSGESNNCQSEISRSNFLSVVGGVAAGTVLMVPGAEAKEDPAVKGTKKDPAFEACLSKCMYDCTKPKGNEQKSRAECLPECKQQCATNKSQLLKGEPKAE